MNSQFNQITNPLKLYQTFFKVSNNKIIWTSIILMIQSQSASNLATYCLKLRRQDSPHLIFTPEPYTDPEWYHPLLGYPMCPLIGRYNKGEYRIGDVAQHLEFICQYQEGQGYRCGNRKIAIPDFITYHLRNIPQVIAYNKPKNLKNEPDVHLIHHVPQKNIKLNWIISFGQIGKDFLNYLNHCYIFDESVFYGDKLNRTTCNIPIIAFMPANSGLEQAEVQRGISMTQWRSEYMSIHLKGGAPAFSPNNMRLGVLGVKKAEERINNNKKKAEIAKQKNKKGKKVQYKQKVEDHKQEEPVVKQVEQFQSNEDFWKEIQQGVDDKNDKKKSEQPLIKQKPQQKDSLQTESHKFVHFYTAVLLQNDHRVNYHWYIDDQNLEGMIREILKNATSVEQFLEMVRGFIGENALAWELGRLLMI